MNGAHALLATLRANNVTVCFANPGTSEMHFVAGLDDVREIRGVLCLFEGVATGAADGYARVTGRAASTLLHLGPGLANGWANLHNARRARVPLINIVGDHATYHSTLDAPLQSNIFSIAGALEGWQRRTLHPNDVVNDATDAISAAYQASGQISTLVLPADVSWGIVSEPPTHWPVATHDALVAPNPDAIELALRRLRTTRSAIFLGGAALRRLPLSLAQRIGEATGARVIMETFPTIVERGRGTFHPERMNYLSEFAIAQMQDLETLILIGANEPVGFFAYPDVSSHVVPTSCVTVSLALPGTDTLVALHALVDGVSASDEHHLESYATPEPGTGALDSSVLARVIGSSITEGLIVADESISAGLHLYGATRGAPPHEWMTLTGGAIGFGLPVAVGAAIGSERRVLALEADGSMLYTPQALWTMAREGLDVTVVGLSNRSYAILNLERERVGAVGEGAVSQRLLEIDDPTIDLCALASAQGVPSTRVHTGEELSIAIQRSFATPGPMFIEAVLPKGFS